MVSCGTHVVLQVENEHSSFVYCTHMVLVRMGTQIHYLVAKIPTFAPQCRSKEEEWKGLHERFCLCMTDHGNPGYVSTHEHHYTLERCIPSGVFSRRPIIFSLHCSEHICMSLILTTQCTAHTGDTSVY